MIACVRWKNGDCLWSYESRGKKNEKLKKKTYSWEERGFDPSGELSLVTELIKQDWASRELCNPIYASHKINTPRLRAASPRGAGTLFHLTLELRQPSYRTANFFFFPFSVGSGIRLPILAREASAPKTFEPQNGGLLRRDCTVEFPGQPITLTGRGGLCDQGLLITSQIIIK